MKSYGASLEALGARDSALSLAQLYRKVSPPVGVAFVIATWTVYLEKKEGWKATGASEAAYVSPINEVKRY